MGAARPISELKGATACCCSTCGLVPFRCSTKRHLQCLCVNSSAGWACVKPRCMPCCCRCNIANATCCFYQRLVFPGTKEAPCSCAICGAFCCGKEVRELGLDGKSLKPLLTCAICYCRESIVVPSFPTCLGSYKGTCQFCCCLETAGSLVCLQEVLSRGCKGTWQSYCCEGHFALPPDEDVPCAVYAASCGTRPAGPHTPAAAPQAGAMDRGGAAVAPAKPAVRRARQPLRGEGEKVARARLAKQAVVDQLKKKARWKHEAADRAAAKAVGLGRFSL